jgi:hypothetical protein
MEAAMWVQEIIGYLVAVSLPLWLGVEELIRRRPQRSYEPRRVADRDAARAPRSIPVPSRLKRASGL